MGSNTPLQLNILILGAGIAGLTAATALKHAGHKVTIFESSKLLHEVGAAITLSPNGTRVLSKLNFDFAAAKGVVIDSVAVYDGASLREKDVYPPGVMERIEENLGFPYRAFHRVDLHNELRNLALADDGSGPRVDLHLGVKIVRVDVENAEIEMDDGNVWKGDLVIGADGIHSFVRREALGEEQEEIEDGGWNIYRWLLDTRVVERDAELRGWVARGRNTFVCPYRGKMLRLVWYSCRNGEIQNFAAFCPAQKGEESREDYDASADKAELLKIFSAYHPTLLRLIQQAETIKTWRLRNRTPLSTYIYGKTLLIGDAAHPMLPFNAQGGNQSLEDAGALLALFSNLTNKDQIPERLEMFESVRRKRAGRQQIVSSVPIDEVKFLGEKLRGFEDEGRPEGEEEGTRERILRELGYDVFARCEEVLNQTL